MPPRWLHRCAIATVVLAIPLLLLGAFVTTLGVGMADQRSFVDPLQAAWEFITGEKDFGWRIEHLHRMAAWIVGVVGIVVAVGSWFADPRRWAKWLATLGMLLIGVQGILGIFRVQLN